MDWSEAERRSLGAFVHRTGHPGEVSDLLLLFNAAEEERRFRLPGSPPLHRRWRPLLGTSEEAPGGLRGNVLRVPAHSLDLFVGEDPP